VSVIGWASGAVGLLLLASGLAAALDSEQIVDHPIVVGGAQVALALALFAAAWALLQMRAWGALVIQVYASVFLLLIAAFGSLYTFLTAPRAWAAAPQGIMMLAPGVIVPLVYAVPLVLVIRSLRSVRRRGLLR
jgi:hypothetical protein